MPHEGAEAKDAVCCIMQATLQAASIVTQSANGCDWNYSDIEKIKKELSTIIPAIKASNTCQINSQLAKQLIMLYEKSEHIINDLRLTKHCMEGLKVCVQRY